MIFLPGILYHILSFQGVLNITDPTFHIKHKQSSTRFGVLPKCVKDYEEELREMYIDMIPFLEGDYPDRDPQETTKVVLIKSNSEQGFAESKSQDHDYAHGRIDSILAYKKEIDVSTILDPIPSRDGQKPPSPPKVVMDGAPGVGKTTLTLNACKDWANDLLFKQYELVVLVPLRQSSCREAKGIEDLLPGDDHDLKASVVQYLNKNQGKSVAFIFDGYDELSHDQRGKDSLLMKLLSGKKLRKSAVLVTSRPYTSGELLKLPSINRHVEILGFRKQQIYNCVRKRIKDKVSADNLIQQLEEREDITSLCYIPLLCIIMIHVYESQKKHLSEPQLPATMTELFKYFLVDLMRRQIEIVQNEIEECDDDQILCKVAERLHVLEKLAYEHLVRDKFVFTHHDLKSYYGSELKKDNIKHYCLGLFTSSTQIGPGHDQQYQFVHLSIQEYLAARYVSRCLKNDDILDILHQYIDEPRYRLFLLFLSGMSKLLNTEILLFEFCLGWKNSKDYSNQELENYSQMRQSLVARKLLFYINLIFESQCFNNFNLLLQSLPNKNELCLKNETLSLFDCRILTEFICCTNHSWKTLDLENCSLNHASLQVIKHTYQRSVCEEKGSFEFVNFSENDPEIVNNLEVFPWLNKIRSLRVICTSDFSYQKTVESNFESLAHIPELMVTRGLLKVCATSSDSEVTLCQATLGKGFTRYLANVKSLCLTNVSCSTVLMIVCKHYLSKINKLEINDVESLDALFCRDHYASEFRSSKSLQKLTLVNVGLTTSGVIELFKTLTYNCSILELALDNNPACSYVTCHTNLGDALESFLINNATVQTLSFRNKTIDDELVPYLISGVKQNSTLKTLDVCENALDMDSICDLIMSLRQSELHGLNIGGLNLQRCDRSWKLSGGKCYSSSCEILSPIQFYILATLSGVCFDFTPIHTLVIFEHPSTNSYCRPILQALQQVQCIKKLHFGNVQFKGGIGCALSNMLGINSTIQVIHFSGCDFSESLLCFLEVGLTTNTSLKELHLDDVTEIKPLISIIKALQHNCSVKQLELSQSRCLLIQNDSLVAMEFKKLLECNSVLSKIIMPKTSVNNVVISGFAEGLRVNRTLDTLTVSVSSTFTPREAAKFIHSSHESALLKFEMIGFFSVLRNKGHEGWELKIENEYYCWPYLQHIFSQDNNIVLLEFRYSLNCFYQVERVLTLVKCSQYLKDLDLSSQFMSSYWKKHTNIDVGTALCKALEGCPCLQVLKLSNCKLPVGTWEYAAKGLRASCSLKRLIINGCKISAHEGVIIFKSLKNVEELDISENAELANSDYTNELSSAILSSLKSSTSKLCHINLKKSVHNEVAKKIAVALQENVCIKTLELSEQHLSCSVIQQFLMLMVEKQSTLTQLKFSDISFTQRNSEEFLQHVVNKIMKSDKFMPRRCSKLYGGLCKVVLYHFHACQQINITSISLCDVDDDVATTIFECLTTPMLSKVTKLSLQVRSDSCNSELVGKSLEDMLKNNSTIEDLNLCNIHSIVLSGLAAGLSSNHFLLLLYIDVINLENCSCSTIAELLRSVDTAKRLSVITISELPPFERLSIWSMDISTEQLYPLLPWFITSLSDICADESLKSHTAESLLSSCSLLRLNNPLYNNYVDTCVIIKLLKSLKSNTTLKELDLSGITKLATSSDKELCESMKCMLSENMTLEKLNLSNVINDDIATALVSSVDFPRHLHIDAKSMKLTTLKNLIHCVENFSLKSLTIANIFCIQQNGHKKWQLMIFDDILWTQMLTALISMFPTFKFLHVLQNISALECVQKGTPVNFADIMDIQPNCVDLVHTKTKPLPSREIKVLLNMKGLTCLTLSHCAISDSECETIANGLNAMLQLTKLDLSHNFIHEDGTILLCKVLEHNEHVKDLCLSNNDLSDSVNNSKILGLAFEALLKDNEAIVRLRLQSCMILDTVCKCIGQGIQHNKSLNFLDLSHNKISSKGAKSLFTSIKFTNYLKVLFLSGNVLFPCTDDLGFILCEYLKVNSSLTTLTLNCGTIDTQNLLKIASGLKQNNSIQFMTIAFYLVNFRS